jgi:thioesterase domain-containing protein
LSNSPALQTIREIAAHCRGQLPPSGQYDLTVLVGWSFGGVVAHELACQLSEHALPPRHLILIDAYLPPAELTSAIPISEEALRNQFEAELGAVRRLAKDLPNFLSTDAAAGAALFERYESNVRGLCRHTASICDVPTLEIRASKSQEMLRQPHYTPRTLPLRNSERLVLCGDHYSIVAGENLTRVLAEIDRVATDRTAHTATADEFAG